MDLAARFCPTETAVTGDSSAFLQTLHARIKLPEPDRSRLVDDFRQLLTYYRLTGLSESAALARLGKNPLGDFYNLTAVLGERYHNTFTDAFFPLSETRFNQNVWRAVSRLQEPVVPCVLQAAVDIVLPRFPYFSTALRHGLFWLNLHGIRRRIAVTPQRARPGSPIRPRRNRPLFLVEYDGDGIVLEGRHSLVDGNGCVLFLRALTREYLRLKGAPLPPPAPVHVTCSAKSFPSFQTVYGIPDCDVLPSSLRTTRALHLKGKPTLLQPAGYAGIQVPADRLVSLAKARGITVTALLSGVLFLCIRDCLDPCETQGRAKIAVPVNLHKLFPLDTLRNYSMYLNLELPREALTTLDDLLPKVSRQLTEGDTKAYVGSMIGGVLRRTNRFWVLWSPSFIKWCVFSCLRILFWERRTQTMIFSNLGVIPDEFGGALRHFSVAASPVKPLRRKVVLATLGNTALMTLTKTTPDDAFERAFLRHLQALGLPARPVTP